MTSSNKRLEWLKGRQSGIGGSDVSAILGLNKYKTALDVYASKVEPVTDEAQSESAHFGTLLEDTIAKEFTHRTGLRVQRVNRQLSSNSAPWRLANIDRAVINETLAGRVTVRCEDVASEHTPLITTDRILECKTASAYLAHEWGTSQEEEIKTGRLTTEHKIPLAYECQIQWYMGVLGVSLAYIAVLIGGNDFRIYAVPRNDEVITALFEQCDRFWHEHVLKRVPPAPMTAEDVATLFPNDSGDLQEANERDAILISELRNVNAQIKTLKEKEDDLKNELVLSLKDKTGMTLGGEKAFTYKAQTSSRFNSTDFKRDHPELYSEYVKTSQTRVFRLS